MRQRSAVRSPAAFAIGVIGIATAAINVASAPPPAPASGGEGDFETLWRFEALG